MDVARWAIKGATLPTKVWSLGGRFGYEDQGQTPNTQMAVMEFGDVLLVFEVRGLVSDGRRTQRLPAARRATSSTRPRALHRQRHSFYAKNGKQSGEAAGQGAEAKVTPGGPFGSWLHAVRSRKAEDLNADVEIAHYSAALCHLANISYRLGEKVPFDKKTGRLGDNREVVETFENLRQNLKGVGVKLEETEYTLGKVLTMDPKEERFTGEGAEKANALLTRKYRKPFVMPEKV